MYETTKLDNGLRIISSTMPEAGSLTLAFFVGAGGRYEKLASEYGVAHFLEHLLFKGTTKRPTAKQVTESIDSVGGYINAYTSEDHSSYYIKLPKQHFATAFDVLSDLIAGPLLRDEDLENERCAIIEEMNVYKDDPARYVFDLVGELVWPKDNLKTNVIGSIEVIEAMPKQTIADFYRALYTMDNMVISAAGSIDHETLVEAAEKGLGKIRSKASRDWMPVKWSMSTNKSKIINAKTNQNHLVICSRAPLIDADDEIPFRIASTILGSDMSSRLYQSVREDKGLAYAIYSTVSSFVDSGKFEIYAGLNKRKTNQAVKVICQELKIIREQLVSGDELSKAKEQIKGRLIMSLENNAAVADHNGVQMILTNRVLTLKEILERIEAVTSEQIKQAVNKYLQPDDLRLAAIGHFSDYDRDELENIISS